MIYTLNNNCSLEIKLDPFSVIRYEMRLEKPAQCRHNEVHIFFDSSENCWKYCIQNDINAELITNKLEISDDILQKLKSFSPQLFKSSNQEHVDIVEAINDKHKLLEQKTNTEAMHKHYVAIFRYKKTIIETVNVSLMRKSAEKLSQNNIDEIIQLLSKNGKNAKYIAERICFYRTSSSMETFQQDYSAIKLSSSLSPKKCSQKLTEKSDSTSSKKNFEPLVNEYLYKIYKIHKYGHGTVSVYGPIAHDAVDGIRARISIAAKNLIMYYLRHKKVNSILYSMDSMKTYMKKNTETLSYSIIKYFGESETPFNQGNLFAISLFIKEQIAQNNIILNSKNLINLIERIEQKIGEMNQSSAHTSTP